MSRFRRIAVFAILLSALLVVPQPAVGSWVPRSFFELVVAAEEILVVRVQEVRGEEHGKSALAAIERGLKGRLTEGIV